MPISEQTLETLEFPKIRERLARHTSFSASRELALRLLPSTDAYVIRRRLQLTSEARRLLDERPDASIGGARDIRAAAGLARRGGVLDAAVFLEIAGTLRSGRLLRAMLLKQDAANFALLRELAEDLPNLPAVEDDDRRDDRRGWHGARQRQPEAGAAARRGARGVRPAAG